MTWLELEPAVAPRTPEEMERMGGLGPARGAARTSTTRSCSPSSASRSATATCCASSRSHTPRDEPVLERELRIETLARLAALYPVLSGQALSESLALRYEAMEPLTEVLPPVTGFPVERVLRDLI